MADQFENVNLEGTDNSEEYTNEEQKSKKCSKGLVALGVSAVTGLIVGGITYGIKKHKQKKNEGEESAEKPKKEKKFPWSKKKTTEKSEPEEEVQEENKEEVKDDKKEKKSK